MRKPVLGILGFSDGDKAAHEMLKPIVQAQVDAIAEALKKDGRVDVVVADGYCYTVINSKKLCRGLKSKGCRCYSVCIWCICISCIQCYCSKIWQRSIPFSSTV